MKKNRIKTLAGDRMTVEVSPYDLEKGRLIFRHKDERAQSTSVCRSVTNSGGVDGQWPTRRLIAVWPDCSPSRRNPPKPACD
jgi:hypothetical protein